MDAIMKMAEEQPLVLAAIAGAVLLVIVSLFGKKKSPENDAKSLSRDIDLMASEPIKSASKGAKTKKGKKGKKGASGSGGKAKVAPAPAPEPVVEEPKKKVEQPADEAPAAGGKKKKKKKKKKGGGGGANSMNGKKGKSQAAADDDDDSDEEDEIARLLNKRQLAKVTGKKSAAASKAATTTTTPENGSRNRQDDNNIAASAVTNSSTAPVLAKEEWVSVNKGHAPTPEPSPTADAEAASTEEATSTSEEIHTTTLDVSLDDPPLIIGPKGATIQAIQESSLAHLDVNKTAFTASVKFTGTESAIANAMEQVKTLIATAAEEKRRATAYSITLSGDKINYSEGVKAIIGRGGSTIQDIQAKTSTNINADVEKGEVVITGPVEEDVEEAAKLCKYAVYGESQHVIELETRGMVLVVYGKDFTKIREMQNESGAKLDIEKGTTTLKMSGSIEAVRNAREMVEEWMEFCRGTTIQIEANKVGAVYGKGGTTIRRIQDRTGAFIEVDDKGKKGKELVDCRIMGQPDAVKEAETLFQKAIDGEVEVKPGEVLETLDLGNVGAPAIIGRGGTKIRELEQAHAVKLSVNSDTGFCQIVGKKEGVDSAKRVIEGICKPLWEEQRLLEEAVVLAKNQADAWSMDKWDAVEDDAAGW